MQGGAETPFEFGNLGVRTPDEDMSMNSLDLHSKQKFQKPDTSESFYFHRKRKNRADLASKNVDKRTFSGVKYTIKSKNITNF